MVNNRKEIENMKKRILNVIIAASCTALLASCAITLPVAVSNAPIGTKTGVSETTIIFGSIYLNSNYGVKEAAQKGKITGAIATIDEKTTNLFFITKKELIVTSK
jgi:hypothetical protein